MFFRFKAMSNFPPDKNISLEIFDWVIHFKMKHAGGYRISNTVYQHF